MKLSIRHALLPVLIGVLAFAPPGQTQPKLTVRVDVRADDAALQYEITKHIVDAINASTSHTLTAGQSAERHIHVAAAKATSSGAVVGVALAVLLLKGNKGQQEVLHFSNQFAPVAAVEAAIGRELPELLK